jgi:hypothetical protein
MHYDALSRDVAEIFEEASHLARRPAWTDALEVASIHKGRPPGMVYRYEDLPVSGPVPTITARVCAACGETLELRQGHPRPIHLGKRIPGRPLCLR